MLIGVVLASVIGLMVGSFLNVVVLRLHAGKKFTTGRSQCPKCNHVLSPLELVPVFSWLALRGRCRSCKQPISKQYPLVELLTGTVFAAIYLLLSPQTALQGVELVLWWYIAASFIVLAVYDLKWYLLPDKVLLPVLVPAVLLIAVQFAASHSLRSITGPLEAGVLFGGAFYLLALVSNGKWMGGGDIKLAFVMGLLLGLQKTALAMFLAFDAAAIVGIILIAAHRKKRTDQMPFGPFLIGGTLVAVVFGTNLIHWYLHVSGADLLL